MTPPNNEEVLEWARFLGVRWEAYAREKKLRGRRDGKHLRAFMAGGYAVLDAILEMEAKREEKKA